MKIELDKIYEGCIYKIINIINNKVYVGSSFVGFLKRKRCHLTNLRKNKHHSPKLQNAWNKYGEESFTFEIIEYCDKLDILNREQYWINYYDSYNKGYNSSPIAGNCEGREVKLETRLKISNSLKGRKVIRTKNHNIKLAATKYKAVVQYNDDNQIINEFMCLNDAAHKLGLCQSIASNYCRGKRKDNKFILKYKYEDRYK